MKTIRKVEVTPVFVQYVPEKDKMEQNKIYISKQFEVAVHLCLCGCNTDTVTPLTNTGWTLTETEGRISLTPSIANYQFPCKSHYIITNNVANFV